MKLVTRSWVLGVAMGTQFCAHATKPPLSKLVEVSPVRLAQVMLENRKVFDQFYPKCGDWIHEITARDLSDRQTEFVFKACRTEGDVCLAMAELRIIEERHRAEELAWATYTSSQHCGESAY